jgi:predicted nucleic acid-binding Zn ribbon protein
MTKKEEPLQDVIQNLIEKLGKREKGETTIIKAWREAIGEKKGKHTKPESLNNGKLIVTVANSAWLYKLNSEKRDIIKNINKILGKKEKIKEIQLRIGKLEE